MEPSPASPPQQDPNLGSVGMSHNSNGGGKNPILIIIFIVLALAAVFAVYNFVNSNDENTDDNTPEVTNEVDPTVQPTDETEEVEPTVEPTETPEGLVEVDLPDSWKKLEAGELDYTAYRPSNFYYRRWGNTVGIDPNELPEVGEYAGVISITKHAGSTESKEIENYSSSMTSPTETSITYKSGTWVILTGVIPESEMFAEQNAKIAIMEYEGNTYVVNYSYEAGSVNKYEDNFEIFVANIEFIDEE